MTTEAQPSAGPFSWLADFAAFQCSSSIAPPGLHEEEKMWRIGTLRFWKSEAFNRLRATNPTRDANPCPSYRRASLDMTLFPDMRLEAESFTTKDGRHAIAILLRSEKDPEGTFGTFTLDEKEAKRIVALVNDEMDTTRKLATERFRASGGDPAAVASARAPSSDEMLDQLRVFFGNPDDDRTGDASTTEPPR